MTFLQQTSHSGLKKTVVAFMIIACLTLSAFSQQVGNPQNQGKRYGDPGFVGETIAQINVVNADIREILNYFTEQYGINFVIDKSVPKTPVTVNISDVPWNIALDSILRSQDLGIQVNGSILRVADAKSLATESEIQAKIRDSQIDSSPLYTEFIRLNYARAAGGLASTSSQAGSFSGGATAAATSGASSPSSGATTGGQGGGAGLLPIIQRRLSRRGAIEVDERSNTLIVTDVRENIDAVRQLVSLLDQPEPQVEIEARVVVATRNFSRDVGVQLAALVLGRNGAAGSGGTLPGTATSTGTAATSPNGIPTGVGTVPNNDLVSSIPNTVIGLTTGIFGTAQISALITAGEQQGQAKTIATPRVTALNNRQAEIKSSTKVPITTIQPGSAAGGAVIATTEYVDVPLRLQITPQITDAGTVILNVTAENSSTAPIAGAPPAINTQTMTSQVMVPDGGTTVVGGVLFDDERESQDRTPGVWRIPILGNLFKRKGISRNTNEILFFITPRIYRPDYNGNPTAGTVSNGTRTTTILQPVPLGNPASNSTEQTLTPQPTQQPVTIQLPTTQPVISNNQTAPVKQP
jgi:type IV pilus assembly protein PilQ